MINGISNGKASAGRRIGQAERVICADPRLSFSKSRVYKWGQSLGATIASLSDLEQPKHVSWKG